MHRRILCSLLILSGALPCSAVAAEKLDLERVTPVASDQPIPVQDFFRPPIFRDPALNDPGTHLAALVTSATDKTALLVMDLDKLGEKPQLLTLPADRDVYHFDWINDTRLIYSASEERIDGFGVFVVNVGKSLNTYAAIERAGATLVDAPDARRTRPLMRMLWDITSTGDGRKGQVIEIDTDLDLTTTQDPDLAPGRDEARNERHITRTHPEIGGGLETGYLSDRAGELAFGLTTRDGVSKLHQLTGESWTECPVDLDAIDVISYGSKPGELIVRGPHRPDKPRALQFMDGPTGTLGEAILEDPGYDFYGHLIRDPRTKQILGLSFDRNIPAVFWFSEDYRAVQKFLDGNFPGKIVRTWPADHTGRNFFVQVFSDRQPATYYRVNLETRQLALIKNSAPWIDPERMRPMTMMKFRTAEGRQLDAYVTLPAGASKEKPVALVVLPHDGPWARDRWGYHSTVQFLASRGYAVLQPNYRGSDGTCWMFPYEDRWAFRKMHDDVTAATRALLKTGLIDRDRVAIMGSSFGGYLAISGVVHEPALYRCAVTVAGTFDWAEIIQEVKYSRFDNSSFGLLVRRLGNPKDDPAKFEALSPGRFIERVQAPVFVAHDKDDAPTIVSESRRLIASLKKHDKPHEVVVTAREGHGTQEIKETVELHARVAEFLEKNLAPRPAPTPAP